MILLAILYEPLKGGVAMSEVGLLAHAWSMKGACDYSVSSTEYIQCHNNFHYNEEEQLHNNKSIYQPPNAM